MLEERINQLEQMFNQQIVNRFKSSRKIVDAESEGIKLSDLNYCFYEERIH